tara:strand:+ start:916 stop:1443 length:528 start_codon:yes stop_codon:yes gene_type:complete
MKNTAIVIGHHEGKKGFFSKHFGMNEFDFYNKVVKKLSNVEVFRYDSGISGYKSRVKDTAKKLDNFDLVVELHFNGFDNIKVGGCETLYLHGSKEGKRIAKMFSGFIHDATGIKLRNNGLKALRSSSDRGFASVHYPTPPSILIEPFFGSNVEDCKKIESSDNLACIINNFLENV